jgi:hypothetical protein
MNNTYLLINQIQKNEKTKKILHNFSQVLAQLILLNFIFDTGLNEKRKAKH